MPATENFLWNQKKLHVVFAISCVVLLASIFIMLVQDYSDDWRGYQRTNVELQAKAKERDIQQLRTDKFEQQQAALASEGRRLRKQLDGEFGEVASELDKLRDRAVRRRDALALDLKNKNAKRDEAKGVHGLAIGHVTAERDAELQAKVVEAQADADATRLELEDAQAELDAIGVPDPRSLVLYLEKRVAEAKAVVEADAKEYEEAKTESLGEEVVQARYQTLQRVKATLQAIESDYSSVRSSVGDVEGVDESEVQRAGQLYEVARLSQAIDVNEKDSKKLEADLQLVQDSLEKLKPDNAVSKFKNALMKLPIIEGFNGPRRVKQDWLPELHLTLGMTQIARFDRCRTCHINMDRTVSGGKPAFPHGEPSESDDLDVWLTEGKVPHPYSTHPNTDLFVTASSPHPVSKFGCTICHAGQGSGTSFGNAEHSANDPHQGHEWEDEYHWHPNHFWEYPMLPERFQESGCIKCHHDVVELAENPEFGNSAPTATKGFQLIQKYGCFGCHEIHGFDGGDPIGPDMRLEPQTAEQQKRIDEDSSQVAGLYRKVGPGLRHVAAKTTADFIANWSEIPSRFRPSTKMPQFFALRSHLTDPEVAEQTDDYEAVELAGISQVLVDGSQPIDLLKPEGGYQPNAERGKAYFSEKGCVACHIHEDVPGTTSDFGPNITDIHLKVNRNVGSVGFSDWLYTWVKEPTRYHARTKMPVPDVGGFEGVDGWTDPAADITAYLLSFGEKKTFETRPVKDDVLDELVTLYLRKARFSKKAVDQILESRQMPLPSSKLKGDESVLATEDKTPVVDDEAWRQRKLAYVGKRSISRYGCYACHDIPGYEDSRPIGVALQDWGRKDTSKLGLEHIADFLQHHGEENGAITDLKTDNEFLVRASRLMYGKGKYADQLVFSSGESGAVVSEDGASVQVTLSAGATVSDLVDLGRSSELFRVEAPDDQMGRELPVEMLVGVRLPLAKSTDARVEDGMAMATAGATDPARLEPEMRHAYLYDSLLHHGRPGFIWQKLRAPRSYDYRTAETKAYDERLRMPKFPLQEDEVEAIATFVLGLVADPPAEEYLYRPDERTKTRIDGEFLMAKYNCTGCHMVEMPEFTVAVDVDEDVVPSSTGDNYKSAFDLLAHMRPARSPFTGDQRKLVVDEEDVELPVATFRGLEALAPDPEDDFVDQEATFQLWETVEFGSEEDSMRVLPGGQLTLLESKVLDRGEGRGGDWAQWLVEYLMQKRTGRTRDLAARSLAWQSAPPPLYQEGFKVQTAWLHKFLLNPMKVRHTTVLQMPRFNMSDEEATILANYFAAVDGVPFPYNSGEATSDEYVAAQSEALTEAGKLEGDYLDQSWSTLNGLSDGVHSPINATAAKCLGCHSVGGLQYQAKPNDPTAVQGPDLRRVQERLRPDWVLLWLHNPKWITPYTSMPVNFSKTKEGELPTLFKGDSESQIVGTRDALLNYTKLMEIFGPAQQQPVEANSGSEAVAGE